MSKISFIRFTLIRSDWAKRQVVKLAGIASVAVTTYLASHIPAVAGQPELIAAIGAGVFAGGTMIFEMFKSYLAAHE